MAFHRLTVPTYFGGLPGGYDYANNAVAGTPAPADGARATGPNAGTYFVGKGEDGRAQAANRGLKALAQNTDHLDDLLRRDVAVTKVLLGTAPGGGTSSINLTGPLWAGLAGTPNTVNGIRSFIQLTDENDNEIFTGGVECKVTAITGATPGDEWVGNITLTVSPAIPAATNYKVFYFERKNLAVIDKDAIVRERKYALYSGGAAWADGTTNPLTTVTGQLSKILTELSALTGVDKIGAAGITGTPYAVLDGTLAEQLIDIVAALNTENAAMVAAVAAAAAAAAAALAAYKADMERVRTLTAGATINTPNRDATIYLNPAAPMNLQLPNPATAVGHRILLINDDGTMAPGNAVTLVRFAAEEINNLAADFVLSAPYGRWWLSCDGTNWNLV
jgi:hypothetical protein